MLHLLEDAHWVERPDEARRLRLLICQVPRSLYDAIENPLSTPNQDGISDERLQGQSLVASSKETQVDASQARVSTPPPTSPPHMR